MEVFSLGEPARNGRHPDLQRIIESAPVAMVMAGRHGNIRLFNAEAERIFGYSREEVLFKPLEILLPERFRHAHGSLCSEFFGAPEVRPMGAGRDLFARRKDGSELPVEIGLTLVEMEGETWALATIVDISTRQQAEHALREISSGLSRQVEERSRELQETSDHLRSVQMQLIQAEKLDSLGRLAAGVAHEVKNPLAVLLMGVNYFETNAVPLGDTATLVLAQMKDAISRADRIVKGMLDFSRANDFALASVPINEIVKHAVELVQHEAMRTRVVLHPDLVEPSPRVQADRGKIEQVLINLLMNAIQAMPQGGDIHVRTRLGSIGSINRDEGRREVDLLRAGDEVAMLEIRDHGPGVPPDLLKRIFEPFFTTKPTGVGCGLGLPVAKNIVELHRGRLQVQNAHPQGLMVRIFLKTDHGSPAYEPDSVSDSPAGATL